MLRLAIAFVLALAATEANAQDRKSEQSQTLGRCQRGWNTAVPIRWTHAR